MLKISSIIGLASSCVLFASISSANDAVGPGDSDSKWVLGLGAGAATNIYVGENDNGFAFPNFRYNGDRLFFADGNLGLNLFTSNEFSGGIIATGDASYLVDEKEYRDNKELLGIKERKATIEAGFYLNHTTSMGRLNFTALTDAGNKHDGHSLSVNYTADLEMGGWKVNPYVGASWMSKEKVDHHYGVRSNEVTSTRAFYQGKAATNLFAGVRGRYEITKKWDVNLNAGYTRLGSGITDSSIVDEKNAFHTTVAVNYNF